MTTANPVQVIAVSGGKGGTGKTSLSVNLAIALAQRGRRVVVLDGDLGLGNIDVSLGITASHTLEDVLRGDCELRDVLMEGPGGIRIVPAPSGSLRMTRLGDQEYAGLINAFSELGDEIDVLVIDTASGISDAVVNFLRAAQELLLVVCDEPTSITDTYALVKLMNRDYGINRFRVIANQVRNEQEGRQLYEKLIRVTERFLDVALEYAGMVPYDETFKKAVQRQRAVVEAYPRARASLAIKALAEKVDGWPLPSSPRGHVEFFVERLV
ncbi:MinD/ParA family protein [Marinobacter pelagius]|uniref:MinD/ParA family ATP-binding protein n=1 Tax=Marinobacter sp. C7 TaxID=2951363 RepID=UPI001EF07743|nr:MinD/ParA family protein [Marinobacter sp. C7]MCG7199202.1 MinD/ParA family protein [Marinobacter sp. C7]